MIKTKILIRQVTPRDSQKLYQIRNHYSVRKFLIDPKPLNYKKHLAWFRKTFPADKTQVHFLVKYKNKYIGFILLRNIDRSQAEIGIMFEQTTKNHWPIIYSTVFILNYGFNNLKLKKLYSYVSPKNIQAIKFNKGFSGKKINSDKPNIYKYIYLKKPVYQNTIYKRVLRTSFGAGCPILCR
jgi:RimJ/RimL family protein N-acetyltransferase